MHNQDELDTFIDRWPASPDGCREVFTRLYDFLKRLADTRIEFHSRPGISYSLRGIPAHREEYPLYVMIDVIDDQPRWLSVCFYERTVTDDAGRGDRVPGGLLGEDGLCFDVESDDEELLAYLQERIVEACEAVSD